MLSNIESLQGHVIEVLREGDCEKADLFSEIFTELALSHVNQIVDQGSPILQILLQLQQLPSANFSSQVNFWKQLFKAISNLKN